jgi:hypothetical protein
MKDFAKRNIVICYAIVFAITLNVVGLKFFSWQYHILFMPTVLILLYTNYRRKNIKTFNKSVDDSITFFDDYVNDFTNAASLPNDVILEKHAELNLHVRVKDDMFATIYLLKWLQTKRRLLGCELIEIILKQQK